MCNIPSWMSFMTTKPKSFFPPSLPFLVTSLLGIFGSDIIHIFTFLCLFLLILFSSSSLLGHVNKPFGSCADNYFSFMRHLQIEGRAHSWSYFLFLLFWSCLITFCLYLEFCCTLFTFSHMYIKIKEFFLCHLFLKIILYFFCIEEDYTKEHWKACDSIFHAIEGRSSNQKFPF